MITLQSKLNKSWIINTQLFFLSLGIISAFSEFLTATKNISASILFIILLLNINLKKITLFYSYKNNGVLIALILFLILFVISGLQSIMPSYSLNYIRKDLIFGITIYLLRNNKNLIAVIFGSFVFTLFITNIHYYLKASSLFNTYNIFNHSFEIERNFVSYILPIILPFNLYAVLFFNNIYLKALIFINILFSLMLLSSSGSRGAYFSIGLEVLIACIFSAIYFYRQNKKVFKMIIVVFFVILGVIYYLIKDHPKFTVALDRGLWPNGRDIILEQRFNHIFYDNKILGIGFGKEIYWKTLEENNAPKTFGTTKNGKFYWWRAHNTYADILFTGGILGLMSFIVLLVLSLQKSFRIIFFKKDNFLMPKVLMAMAISATILDHYVFRTLIESLYLGPLILLVFLLISLED